MARLLQLLLLGGFMMVAVRGQCSNEDIFASGDLGTALGCFASNERHVTEDGKVVVQGAGASFPFRLYSEAIFAYGFQDQTATVSYTSTGSGKVRFHCAQDAPIFLL